MTPEQMNQLAVGDRMPSVRAEGEFGSPKPTRGRRPIFSAEFRNEVRARHANLRSERSVIEACYASRTRQILQQSGLAAELGWLDNKAAILAALGRIPQEDHLLSVALQLCQLKPSSNSAVLMIRRFRLGTSNADAKVLVDSLIRTINRYLLRFSGTSINQILEALQTTTRHVESVGIIRD